MFLVVTIALLVLALYFWWRFGAIDWQSIGIALGAFALFIVLYIFRKPRLLLMSIIGENRSTQRPLYRLLIPLLLVAPLVFYLLLSGTQKSLPTALQWSIIAVAPTLGGLLLVGATNRRLKRGVREELISAAQKLLFTTVLFIVFTCLFFTVELIGGINTSSIDLSLLGWVRGVFFWAATVFFYGAAYLFLVAIIDLVLALRHLKA